MFGHVEPFGWRKETLRLLQILNNLNDRPGEVWYTDTDGVRKARVGTFTISRAYGQPRLIIITSESGGECDISPRCSNKELAIWMSAYIEGIEYARKLQPC